MDEAVPQPPPGSLDNVIAGIARYFRDFLDTDFKRQRLPKRGIVRQDRDGNLVGVPLDRYESLARRVWQALDEPIGNGKSIWIRRGQYRAPLSSSVQNVIDRHTNSVNDVIVGQLVEEVLGEARSLLGEHKDDPNSYRTPCWRGCGAL